MPENIPNCPIIVSADNLDYQQSFSRVYSGKQGVGWHGTTVQIIFPHLNTEHLQLPSPNDTSLLKKRTYLSRSPAKNQFLQSPQPKKVRRRRTGCENQDPAVHPFIDMHASSRTSCIPSTSSTSAAVSTTNIDRYQLSIEQFGLVKEEEEALHKLHDICERYIVLKLQMYYCLSQIVPSPEISSIIYYKVLGERCDDKETLLGIINDLHTEIKTRNT